MSEVARVYGKALYDLAKEMDMVKTINDEWMTLSQVIDSTIIDAMNSVDLPKKDKKAIIASVFENHISSMMIHFLDVLIDNHRFSYFDLIKDDYFDRYRKDHHILLVMISSARPLSDDDLTKIKTVLHQKSGSMIEIDTCIDPTLIAGFTIEMQGRVIDYSMKHRLDALKNELKQGVSL